MSDQELQQITIEYLISKSKIEKIRNYPGTLMIAEVLQKVLEQPIKELAEDYAKFLKWVSEKYCIVPNELIRKEYEEAKSTHDIYTSATCINEMESRMIDHAEGRMCELTTLFGKSLINEEKG